MKNEKGMKGGGKEVKVGGVRVNEVRVGRGNVGGKRGSG